jgi:hypothetical protein
MRQDEEVTTWTCDATGQTRNLDEYCITIGKLGWSDDPEPVIEFIRDLSPKGLDRVIAAIIRTTGAARTSDVKP